MATPSDDDCLELPELLLEYDAARAWSTALVTALDPDQVAWRPHDDSSAIGWHLGHQAAVNHYMVRNLTAAEPSFAPDLDRLFDSATPERDRGSLPALERIHDYRADVGSSTHAVIGRIAVGDVGAPVQLRRIADGLLRAVVNHEYQHAAWILEVRDTMTDEPAPTPASNRLTVIDGYRVLV